MNAGSMMWGRKWAVCLGVFLLAAASGWCQSGIQEVPLTIFHINDWHGTLQPKPVSWIDKENPPVLGGAPHLFTAVQERKLAALKDGYKYLVLDSGDRFQGALEVNLSQGELMTELWRRLKCTVGAVGNHDFDYGPEAFRKSVQKGGFPLVAANLQGWPNLWRPSVRCVVDGVNIGVFGLMTDELPQVSMPDDIRGLSLAPIIDTARAEVRKLREQGCDLIVLLSHCGHEVDQDIARQVAGIDVILGGHTNHHLEQPLQVGGTLICQTYGYGTHFGVLQAVVDVQSNRLKDWSYELIALDPKRFPADPEIVALLASYSHALESITAAEITRLPEIWFRRGESGPRDLGAHLVRAIREKTGTDVAFFHRGGMRSDLPAGVVRWKDVYQALPFAHRIIVGELSGQILQSLSGAKVENLCIDRLPLAHPDAIDPNRTYRVAFNDFLAGGGDGFVEFAQARSDGKNWGLVRDAFLEFLRRQ